MLAIYFLNPKELTLEQWGILQEILSSTVVCIEGIEAPLGKKVIARASYVEAMLLIKTNLSQETTCTIDNWKSAVSKLKETEIAFRNAELSDINMKYIDNFIYCIQGI
ncbi:hypothetical protein FACS189465_3610 [Clostridia bacterium]|nr:hypothetical protein FACS189465_3610 [Clostridia bacterium]